MSDLQKWAEEVIEEIEHQHRVSHPDIPIWQCDYMFCRLREKWLVAASGESGSETE